MPWLDGLATIAGRLAGTRGAVLCFHGLEVEEKSPSAMHISLRHLAAILDSIRAVGRLVPLREILERHRAGRRTSGMVALTADDAYASWLSAESLLASRDVPLTLFAVADTLNNGRSFWWDRIDAAASRANPGLWRRFEEDCGLPDSYRRGHPINEGVTRPLRQWILAEHAGRWPAPLEEPLARLEEEVGGRTSQRAMTAVELSGFLARTGADVGVHTVSHAALPFLPDPELIVEIRRGHELLRERFPAVLPYLAIPFGLFDARTLRLSAEAGMTVSLTLEGDPLDQPFAAEMGVPRLCVVREQAPERVTLKASRVAGLLSRLRGGKKHPYPVLPSAES